MAYDISKISTEREDVYFRDTCFSLAVFNVLLEKHGEEAIAEAQALADDVMNGKRKFKRTYTDKLILLPKYLHNLLFEKH